MPVIINQCVAYKFQFRADRLPMIVVAMLDQLWLAICERHIFVLQTEACYDFKFIAVINATSSSNKQKPEKNLVLKGNQSLDLWHTGAVYIALPVGLSSPLGAGHFVSS